MNILDIQTLEDIDKEFPNSFLIKRCELFIKALTNVVPSNAIEIHTALDIASILMMYSSIF